MGMLKVYTLPHLYPVFYHSGRICPQYFMAGKTLSADFINK